MIKVSKSRLAGRPGFVALWRDEKGKKFCRGISTTDEVRADEIVAAMQRILNTPALLNPDNPDHGTTLIEAYRAIFGKTPPEPDDTVIINASVPQSSKPVAAIMVAGQIIPTGLRLPPRRISAAVQVPGLKDLKIQLAEWKKRALTAEEKVEALQAENLRQSKSLNKHCKVALREGIEDFSKNKNDVSHSSKRAYLAAANDFQLYLGAKKLGLDYSRIEADPVGQAATRAAEVGGSLKIADIRGRNIDDFLSSRSDKRTSKPISEKRKRSLKRELSVPYHFWVLRHELVYDAFTHTQPLTGHKATAPESREMIRTVADLNNLLWALSQEEQHGLYWQAFVGTAALTGADLGDLFDLTPQDLILEEPARYMMCRGKTGRQRDTPIERTVLLPILRGYSAALPKGQRFLFPSLLADGTRTRTITQPGQWSGPSAFGDAWKKVAGRCATRIKEKIKVSVAETSFCLLGPRAWRRSAVTFMHGAGCLPGQVARWVGHSVTIGERHYLGDVLRNGLVFEPGAGRIESDHTDELRSRPKKSKRNRSDSKPALSAKCKT